MENMRRLLAILVVLSAAAACASCGAQSKRVRGPDGEDGWYSIRCVRSHSNCVEEAGEVCPNGYDVADQDKRQGVYGQRNANSGFVTTTYQGEMLIKCRLRGADRDALRLVAESFAAHTARQDVRARQREGRERQRAPGGANVRRSDDGDGFVSELADAAVGERPFHAECLRHLGDVVVRVVEPPDEPSSRRDQRRGNAIGIDAHGVSLGPRLGDNACDRVLSARRRSRSRDEHDVSLALRVAVYLGRRDEKKRILSSEEPTCDPRRARRRIDLKLGQNLFGHSFRVVHDARIGRPEVSGRTTYVRPSSPVSVRLRRRFAPCLDVGVRSPCS